MMQVHYTYPLKGGIVHYRNVLADKRMERV